MWDQFGWKILIRNCNLHSVSVNMSLVEYSIKNLNKSLFYNGKFSWIFEMWVNNKNWYFAVIFSMCECLMFYETSTCNQLFTHEKAFEEIATQIFMHLMYTPVAVFLKRLFCWITKELGIPVKHNKFFCIFLVCRYYLKAQC